MKVLILGADGMLGHKLYQVLSRDFDVRGIIRGNIRDIDKYGFFPAIRILDKVDATDIKSLQGIISNMKPNVVINCIGVIDKAFCESDRLTTMRINALFPQRLSSLCQISRTRLIHISTDCVFSGRDGNYVEGSLADATDNYGKTKYLGEVTGDNLLTIRTSLIGRELVRSRGLLEWFIGQKGKPVNGFTNAIFTGFPTVTFARIIKDIITDHPELNGIYHIASEPISKYQLLRLINEALELDIDIIKMPAYHCDRSLDATKFNTATGFAPQPWREMIGDLAEDVKQYEAWR